MVLNMEREAAFADWDPHAFLAGFGCHAPSDQHARLASEFQVLNTAFAGCIGEGWIGLCAIQCADALVIDQDLEKPRAFFRRAARLVIQRVKQMCAIVVELWCFHGAVLPDRLQREPGRLPFSADVYGD